MTVRHSPIVELRRYALNPGMRGQLVDVFERHFIEGQERDGMAIIGQFHDLDDPDAFVWLRGFPDMEARRESLAAFYSGPVWMAQRETANATMITFDDVYLLRPADADGGFALDLSSRAPLDAAGEAFTRIGGLITANLVPVRGDADAFAAWHARNMLPLLRQAGADVIARFVTEAAENNYPALPVRTGEQVLAIFTRFPDRESFDRFRSELAASKEWGAASKAAAAFVAGSPRLLRLSPTPRSALR